ncbi:hypothetical protein BABINDRAFT_158981 [Babjeviella inositovora NRRL Y-12698]|uniref:Uncharacterized protein n=1 Tax=Babjeviella inositovora NRRL Y-12698 TaxID=984486 RepID=A0A1E3QZ63_9ASCO|nr:uncharacterized protein BABINDRAFT_158981 [Babjeviella inositovora NRRL Y-12698]ODQ82372.1 hypothetical protein BABINDRAFT_158981 [Babjeviella inositovora NRRL Y-12698]
MTNKSSGLLLDREMGKFEINQTADTTPKKSFLSPSKSYTQTFKTPVAQKTAISTPYNGTETPLVASDKENCLSGNKRGPTTPITPTLDTLRTSVPRKRLTKIGDITIDEGFLDSSMDTNMRMWTKSAGGKKQKDNLVNRGEGDGLNNLVQRLADLATPTKATSPSARSDSDVGKTPPTEGKVRRTLRHALSFGDLLSKSNVDMEHWDALGDAELKIDSDEDWVSNRKQVSNANYLESVEARYCLWKTRAELKRSKELVEFLTMERKFALEEALCRS